jgi:hypothetical protein
VRASLEALLMSDEARGGLSTISWQRMERLPVFHSMRHFHFSVNREFAG